MKRLLALNIITALVMGSFGSPAWANIRIGMRSGNATSVTTLKISAFSSNGVAGLASLAAPSLQGGLLVLPQTALPLEGLNRADSAQQARRMEPVGNVKKAVRATPTHSKPAETAFAQVQEIEQGIAALESRQESPAEAADVQDLLGSVFDGGAPRPDATAAEAVSAAIAPKASRFARLLPAGAIAVAVGFSYKAVHMMRAPALGDADAGNTAGLIGSMGISPLIVLTAAVAIPFVVVLIPALFKAHWNRRLRQTTKLAKAIVAHADKDWETPLYHFYTKTVRRKRGKSHFIDKVTVQVPNRGRIGDRWFQHHGRIEILSQRSVPQNDGSWILDSYRYHYKGNGKAISGLKRVEKAQRIHGKIEREELGAKFLGKRESIGRGLLGRWAPHESGKGWSFLAGLVAAIPAYFMADMTVNPMELFLWAGIGLVGAFLGEWWRSRRPRTPFRIKDGSWVVVYTGLIASTLVFAAASIPAGLSLFVGFLTSLILSRTVLPGAVSWIKSPLKTSLLRRGTSFSKFKLAMIALFFASMMAGVVNPFPISAHARTTLAAQMQTGPVGNEYAKFFREHAKVPIYFTAPWHKEDMTTAVGRHHDLVPMVSPARISLNSELYGVRSSRDQESMELALSTVLHELDHDRTEEKNGGVPTTLEHEYSAWDHQARFILEQFRADPDIFKPGYNNKRKRIMLERARNWLDLGPTGFHAYVSGHYPKIKALSVYKVDNKERLQAFYDAHHKEMEEEWVAVKRDVSLRADVAAAISALRSDGAASAETIRPSDFSLIGRFLTALFGLLAVFGFNRMVGPRRSKK